MLKKIIVVSFEMFPVISARSFRTTELVKELARQGYDVTLYTVWKNFDYERYSKNIDVKLKNLGFANFLLGKNIFRKVLNRLAAYPLIKLIPMVKNAIESEGEFDYLITIAAPHPIHWGASFVKNRNFKCWTADCGDPFMKNPFATYPFYLQWFEKRWCKLVDYITVPIPEAKSGYYKEFQNKVRVIPQGFDFDNIRLSQYSVNNVPTFAFAGTSYVKGRNATKFLEYLSTLEQDFKFIVYTSTPDIFRNFERVLGDKLEIRGFIPREELLMELSKMDFLINIKNESSVQSASKLIDYFLVKRPILEVSSDFKEGPKLNEFLNTDYTNQYKIPDVEIYNIKNVAKEFINLYNTKL